MARAGAKGYRPWLSARCGELASERLAPGGKARGGMPARRSFERARAAWRGREPVRVRVCGAGLCPRKELAGYPSRVCSILGAESTWGTAPGAGEGVDRIAEAIDQLESDLRAETGTPEMSARVAAIWLMVTALDPELARLVTRYTAPGNPADGIGSLPVWRWRLVRGRRLISARAYLNADGHAAQRGMTVSIGGDLGRRAQLNRDKADKCPASARGTQRILKGLRREPVPGNANTDAFRGRPGAVGVAWCIRATLWRRLWIPSTGPVDNRRG
jgi:hypothetical protein